MPLRLVKEFLRRSRLARAGVRREIDVPVFVAGARSGVWAVCPENLTSASVVYSFGVGDNIAWDLAMIDAFGVSVHAFDPTPGSIGWVRSQHLPPGFHFHPLGLADHDGTLSFRPPSKSGNCNYTPCTGGDRSIRAPVCRLSTILAELDHDHIDVLKIDIEGAEYDTLDDLLAAGLRPGQVLVEFHHNLPGVPFTRTLRAIRSLQEAGYRLFHISRRGLELSFLLDDQPSARVSAASVRRR
jgi:FkbM family methyltransferase